MSSSNLLPMLDRVLTAALLLCRVLTVALPLGRVLTARAMLGRACRGGGSTRCR